MITEPSNQLPAGKPASEPSLTCWRVTMADNTTRTVERVKKSLDVVATKGGFQGAWAWRLPDPKTANPMTKTPNMRDVGGLWRNAMKSGPKNSASNPKGERR
jgi:hypothetical protein